MTELLVGLEIVLLVGSRRQLLSAFAEACVILCNALLPASDCLSFIWSNTKIGSRQKEKDTKRERERTKLQLVYHLLFSLQSSESGESYRELQKKMRRKKMKNKMKWLIWSRYLLRWRDHWKE